MKKGVLKKLISTTAMGVMIGLLFAFSEPLKVEAATTVDTKAVTHIHYGNSASNVNATNVGCYTKAETYTGECPGTGIYVVVHQGGGGWSDSETGVWYSPWSATCPICGEVYDLGWHSDDPVEDDGSPKQFRIPSHTRTDLIHYTCTHTSENLGYLYLNKTRNQLSVTTSSNPKFTITGYTWYGKASGSASSVTATGAGVAYCNVSVRDSYSGVTSTVQLSATLIASDFYQATASANIATSAVSYTNQTVTLTCTPSGDTPSTYQWYRNSTAIPGANTQTYSATVSGTYYCYTTSVNGASATTNSLAVYVDQVDPTLSLGCVDDNTIWLSHDTTLTANATDSISGVNVIKWYNQSNIQIGTGNSCTVSSSGTYKAVVYDNAGNTTEDTISVMIDKVLPVVSADYDNATWTNDKITITVSVTEEHPDKIYCDGVEIDGTFDALTNGSYTFTATDLAGNVSNPLVVTITHIDKTKPVLTADYDNTTWTNGNVVITLTNTDDRPDKIYCDGIECGSTYTATDNGTYEFYSTDTVGNESDHIFVTIDHIDRIKPTLTVNFTDTWTNSTLTATLIGSDDHLDKYFCGSVECSDTYTISANGNYTFKAIDLAGNVSDPVTITATKIDKNDPTLTIASIEKKKSYEIVKLSYADEALNFSVESLDSLPVSTLNFEDDVTTFETNVKLTQNGTYTWVVADCAGNDAVFTYTVSDLVFTYELDETSEYTHTHSTSTCASCSLSQGEVIGTATLKKEITNKYTLYIESNLSSNCEIVSYAWTGTPTALSIGSVDNNVSLVTGLSTASVEIKDFGDYECDVTWRDKKTGNEFTYAYVYTVEDYDLTPPTVSYHVTKITKDSNTIEFTFNDNFSLKNVSEGGEVLASLSGKHSVKTITFSRNEHNLTVSDMIGNTYSFVINANYIRDNTDYEKGSSYKNISVTAYPITYQYATALLPYTGKIEYALKGNNSTSDYQQSGTFENLYKNGSYTVYIKDGLGNICEYETSITTLTNKLPVTYIDIAVGEDKKENEVGEVLGKQTLNKKIGTTVGGHELGTDTKVSKYYEGYYYTTSTTTIVTALKENIVYRYFKLKYYDVTYKDENGNVIDSEKIGHGKRNTISITPVKESVVTDTYTIKYAFECWVDENGNEADLSYVTKDMTLIPKFVETIINNTHIVTFYPDYELRPDYYEEVTVGHGLSVTPPSASREDTEDDEKIIHYTFSHWKLADGSEFNDFDSITDDVTVFGVFVETIEQKPNKIEDVSEVLELKAESITVEPMMMGVKGKVITNEETPTNAFAKFYKENEGTIKTVAKTAGVSALTLLLLELLSALLTGFGLVQLAIFLFNLITKKKRYIQGAWLTEEEGQTYVDKFGHELKMVNGLYTYKDNTYKVVDATSQINMLSAGRITYKEFTERMKESEVYTVFNADLEIECSNIKNTYNQKVYGFSIINTLKSLIKSAGEYHIKIKSAGKEFAYNISIALNGSKI